MWGNKNNNKKYGYKQQQLQINETAHEMELVIDTFHNTLEALEEYVGKAGYYRDWENRRQICRKSIADSNDTVEGFEDLFLTQLLIVKSSVNKREEFFRKEVQKEYKKWISAVGINVNNCPEKLKNYLFTVNEVLEGRGEDFVNQTKELVKDVKLSPQDALKFFGELQEPLNKNAERGSLLKGKNWNQVESERKLSGGNIEQGEETLGQIVKAVSSNQINFYDSDYHQRQGGWSTISSNNPQQWTNSQIIQDVKDNPGSWRIDEVIAGYDVFNKAKKELALIHNSVHIGYDGEVFGSLNTQLIYLLTQKFSPKEIAEIKQAKNISQTSTNQSIRQEIVGKIKQRISEFKIENLFVLNESGGYGEESWIIHNSAERKSDKNGCLVFDAEKMVKVKDLNEAERVELGIQNNKLEKNVEKSTSSQPQKDNNDNKIGIIATISVFSALVIGGVILVAKKRLNKKVKK